MFSTRLEVLGRRSDHLEQLEASFDLHNYFSFWSPNEYYFFQTPHLLSSVISAPLCLTWPITSVPSLPFSHSVPPSLFSGLERFFHHCLSGWRKYKKMHIWVILNLPMRIYSWRVQGNSLSFLRSWNLLLAAQEVGYEDRLESASMQDGDLL